MDEKKHIILPKLGKALCDVYPELNKYQARQEFRVCCWGIKGTQKEFYPANNVHIHEYYSCETHQTDCETCICGKKPLKHTFGITDGSIELFPIGSTCIDWFENPYMDMQKKRSEAFFKEINTEKKSTFTIECPLCDCLCRKRDMRIGGQKSGNNINICFICEKDIPKSPCLLKTCDGTVSIPDTLCKKTHPKCKKCGMISETELCEICDKLVNTQTCCVCGKRYPPFEGEHIASTLKREKIYGCSSHIGESFACHIGNCNGELPIDDDNIVCSRYHEGCKTCDIICEEEYCDVCDKIRCKECPTRIKTKGELCQKCQEKYCKCGKTKVKDKFGYYYDKCFQCKKKNMNKCSCGKFKQMQYDKCYTCNKNKPIKWDLVDSDDEDSE